ncbi:MAG: hypothetical protein EXX96DRAFT_586009 [Benjaminiella poitrasii]|nr:MAG: hypothetical protein EXX96DRAFT_586009 [Benjaminiella poitrasii]
MADWKQAQLSQWNEEHSEYSDEDEYSDDDEYAPIEATTWGSQTVGNDGVTNVSLTASGWEALIDPSVKIKANGVGSGQLHRKGNNYIPVDEAAIINRRLGKPVPKGAMGPGKKKTKGKKSKPSSGASTPKKAVLVPPSSSAHRFRETVTSGPWANAELASTPFWSQPSSATHGSGASKYATTPAVPAAAPAPRPAVAQPSFTQPAFTQPAFTKPVAPAPAPAKPASQSLFTQGSFASKYASPTPDKQPQPPQQPLQQQQQPPQQQQQPPQQQQQPPQQQQQPFAFEKPASSNTTTTQQTPVFPRLDAPVLNFNIELTPGVNAKFSVYIDDDPLEVVNKFEKEHHLEMNDMAKQRFTQHLQNCLAPYRK